MNIAESLIEIQNLLGDSYFKIGDSLKKMKNEVDITLSEAEKVIDEFRNNLTTVSENSLSGIIMQLEEKVSEAQKNYKEYTDQFLGVMSRIFNSFEVLNNMHEPIERIITAAEQMELLALNAMVVAIQAGNKGGGFTCITDGFQKNARTAFSLAGNLNNQRSVVSDQFDKLKQESSEVLEMQKKIAADIKRSLLNDFSALKTAIHSAVGFLEIVYNEAQQLKPAVNSVFEGLQNQDIIRQSMDHMLMSLEELDNIRYENKSDESVYLKKKLYDLCVFVLDEVIKQLSGDENTLKENTEKMISLLTNLEDKKEAFQREQFSRGSDSSNLINCLYNISETYEGVISESEKICNFQTEIVKYKNKLLKSFALLHDYITAFNDPISLFKNTIVLARIEIARQPVIRNVETSINDISGEVVIISDAAKEIEAVYDSFNMMNKAIDIELKKIIDENNLFTLNFKSDIKKLTDLTDESGRIYRGLLQELSFFNSNFAAIFSDVKDNIEMISRSKESLEIMKADFLGLLTEINSSYEMIDKDKLSVLMENSEIDSLLNKFTIFRHKEKILNEEISGQDASESSITLF